MRYSIGFFYTPNLLFIASINMVLIIIDIGISVRFALSKNNHQKKWKKFYRI